MEAEADATFEAEEEPVRVWKRGTDWLGVGERRKPEGVLRGEDVPEGVCDWRRADLRTGVGGNEIKFGRSLIVYGVEGG